MIRDLSKSIIQNDQLKGTLTKTIVSNSPLNDTETTGVSKEDIVKHAIKRILSLEGGYVNDPDDSGGETIFGITRKNYPNLRLWSIVDKTKNKQSIKLNDHIDEVTMVYQTYNPLKYMKEFTIDEFVGLYAFAINAGLGRIRKISEIYGLYDRSNSSKWKVAILSHYNRLIKIPKNKKFKKGWQRRLVETFRDEEMKLSEV